MDREELLKALNFVKPALASRDFVPIFTSFCFHGESVVAYNDVLGIEYPCKTEFIGAIRGIPMLAGLEYSSAKGVEFVSEKDHEVLIKVGTRRLRFPISPEKDFLFDFPDTSGLTEIAFDGNYQDAIKHCLVAVGTDASRREAMGVTFVFGNYVHAYATDSATITEYQIGENAFKEMRGKSIIMPTDFCRLITSPLILNMVDTINLKLNDDFVVADLGPKCRIFSKLINSEPLDFRSHFDNYLESVPDDLVPLPKKLFQKLAPTVAIMEIGSAGTCEVAIKGGRLKIDAISEFHQELKDTEKLGGPHPDITVNIDPALLIRVLHLCDRFYVLPDCMVLKSGDSFTHLIGHLAAKGE